MRFRMGPVAGLWMTAALSLIAVVGGASSPVVGVAGAICFTLATGFLAIGEAIERHPRN